MPFKQLICILRRLSSVALVVVITIACFNKGEEYCGTSLKEMTFTPKPDQINSLSSSDAPEQCGVDADNDGKIDPYPAIIFIHGFGETNIDMEKDAKHARDACFVGISVQTSLTYDTTPQPHEIYEASRDVACLVRDLRMNRKDIIIPDQIAVAAYSLGGMVGAFNAFVRDADSHKKVTDAIEHFLGSYIAPEVDSMYSGADENINAFISMSSTIDIVNGSTDGILLSKAFLKTDESQNIILTKGRPMIKDSRLHDEIRYLSDSLGLAAADRTHRMVDYGANLEGTGLSASEVTVRYHDSAVRWASSSPKLFQSTPEGALTEEYLMSGVADNADTYVNAFAREYLDQVNPLLHASAAKDGDIPVYFHHGLSDTFAPPVNALLGMAYLKFNGWDKGQLGKNFIKKAGHATYKWNPKNGARFNDIGCFLVDQWALVSAEKKWGDCTKVLAAPVSVADNTEVDSENDGPVPVETVQSENLVSLSAYDAPAKSMDELEEITAPLNIGSPVYQDKVTYVDYYTLDTRTRKIVPVYKVEYDLSILNTFEGKENKKFSRFYDVFQTRDGELDDYGEYTAAYGEEINDGTAILRRPAGVTPHLGYFFGIPYGNITFAVDSSVYRFYSFQRKNSDGTWSHWLHASMNTIGWGNLKGQTVRICSYNYDESGVQTSGYDASDCSVEYRFPAKF